MLNTPWLVSQIIVIPIYPEYIK